MPNLLTPEPRYLAGILRFLGYDPRPEPATFGGRLRAAREAEDSPRQPWLGASGLTLAQSPRGSGAKCAGPTRASAGSSSTGSPLLG